ncbi:MAG TPA: (Fe-S)-binding protein [Anaerolineales bacterium]|nr:(Fe-S)-binding protein [Anaerolineales bacterium]
MNATETTARSFYAKVLDVVPTGERLRLCLECGNCSGICPFGYLMDYPPSRMIAMIRADRFDNLLETDSIWMCVSCFACTAVCPSQVPLTFGLMTSIKEELLLSGNVPAELQTALQKSQRYGNPLGQSPRKRADWIKGLQPNIKILAKAKQPVDVLWFVGDYASYHPRVQLATKALAKILIALGVDFGILGPEENSDGDSQRLAGERGLFETLAEKNGKTFSKYQFNRIITTDPHAYNAIKNEYPQLGVSYPIQHYTEYLVEKIEQLKPFLKREVKAKVTFHDPCYLGRTNNIFDLPRQLLESIPGVELVEMAHNRTNSLCCGGGGGGMWLDGFQWEKAKVRLSDWRVSEALSANAKILAVACPYETPRFEDAAKTVDGADQLKVRDIAELLAQAMEL